MALYKKDKVHPDDKDKVSGYVYKDQAIVLGKQRGRPVKNNSPTYYSQEKKIEAATLYAVLGSVDEVSSTSGIPIIEIRKWKKEEWWVEVQRQVYTEQNENLSARISSTLDETLRIINDRLENGDEVVNVRTGNIVRVPVDTKTLSSLFDRLSHHRTISRGEPTSISANVSDDDRLQKLSAAFERFSKAQTIEGEVTNGSN